MRRHEVLLALFTALAACSVGGSAPVGPVRHDLFDGEWRSVTPSLDFLRLTVQSTSSARDVLAARLTFSGVVWEGSGMISGDSLVLHMAVQGHSGEVGTMVARVDDGGKMRTRVESRTSSPFVAEFIREH